MHIPSSIDLGSVEKPPIFTPEELAAWRHPRTLPLILDLLGPWVQIGLAIAAVVVWNHPLVWVAAFFVIGGAQHGLSLITHEFAHGLIVPKNKRLNRFLGTWVFGGASGLPFRFYIDRHWEHHLYVSTDDDTKLMYRRDYKGWHIVREALLALSGYDYLYQVGSVMWRHKEKAGVEKERKTYWSDFAATILVQLMILVSFLVTLGPVHYFFLWFFPIISSSVFFAKIRSSVEHRPLGDEVGEGTTYFLGTSLPVFRSVNATWWEKYFVTRINFHYHIIHHLWPTISYQYLPEAHRRLTAHMHLPEPPGYLRVLVELYRADRVAR
ncbi:hypothetical protein FJY94_05835 [Candidatus Kaiserbacteria bacterium]|nr:hypothetical protein [Candidatus Kaiserbacteria bacterium]